MDDRSGASAAHHGLPRRVQPWNVMLVVGIVLTSAYFAFPSGSAVQSVAYNVIGLVFVGAILVGVRTNQPADKTIWLLFAAGSLLSVFADSVSTVYLAMDKQAPVPSIADPIYLAAYPFLFVAVARLDRTARGYRLRERHLDAAIIALGAFVLSWQVLISSYAHDSTAHFLALPGSPWVMAWPGRAVIHRGGSRSRS